MDPASFLSDADTHKLVFVNGVFDVNSSRIGELPSGTILRPAAQVVNDAGTVLPHPGNNPLTALNSVASQDGLFLEVPEGVHLKRPVELFFLTDHCATQTMVAPRTLVSAHKGSQLTVVEHFMGPACDAVLNTPVTEILCGENSTVRHLKVIRESSDHLHFGTTHVRQLAGSSYTSREFAFGGSSVRRELHVDLDGPEASCDLTALYMAAGQQRMDMRTRVNHNVPGCRTNELYKGLLDDQARTVFDGLIKVARDAQQTAAFQTNRNLVLSEETISYSIPRLEIYADDVKCSHGSTTGQLDDEQLFFLKSRGFDADAARVMLAKDLMPVRQQIVSVGGDGLKADAIDEIEGRTQPHGPSNIGGAGFQPGGQRSVGRFGESHRLDHVTATSVRGQIFQQGSFAVDDTDTGGAIDLVARKDVEVAVQSLHIDRNMSHGLGTIYDDRDILAVSDADDFLNGVDRTQGIGNVGHGNEFGPWTDKFPHLVQLQLTLFVQGDDFQVGTHAFAQHLPRHDVAVVLEVGDENFVTWAHLLATKS